MHLACPHCSASLNISPQHYGHQVQCPACGNRLTVPSEAELQKQEAKAAQKSGGKPPPPERAGWEEGDHANVNFAASFGFAIVLTVGFLFLLLPFQGNRVTDLFLNRGWVNYVETFLFFWGLMILIMKWRKNRSQERATLLNLFPEHLGKEINVGTVGAFIDHVYQVPPKLRDSLMVNRMRKALELFESRVNNGEVSDFLNTQSEIDANRSSISYSIIKVFLWAIPILGFIGTVIGLSAAVGSLAMGDTSDQEALKASISSLTDGLSTAFDTTLLGLILSILMSFPLAAVQKKEDETLTMIDSFCVEKLLPKLNDSRTLVGEELIQQADSIPQLITSLAKAHETFLVNLNESTRMLTETAEFIQLRITDHQKTVQKTFTDAASKLIETSRDVFLRSNKNLENSFHSIATGIDSINTSLRALGENQIPNEAKKKKGLFSKS